MKIKLITSAAIGALMFMPNIAAAHDEDWYARGNIGLGSHLDADITGDMNGDVESEANVIGSLGLGYMFDNNWRLELDGSSLWNDTGQLSQIPGTLSSIRSNALMLNAIYDFDGFLDSEKLVPYVGAGLGLVNSTLSAHSNGVISGTGTANPACTIGGTVLGLACNIRDDDTTFGLQGIAGVRYALSDTLDWDTQFRYLAAGTPDFEGIGNATRLNSSFDDIAIASIMTGAIWKFGHSAHVAAPAVVTAPPPPPAPAPAPTPYVEPTPAPTTYTCWDNSIVYDLASCAAQPVAEPVTTYTCWDNSIVYDLAQCPATPAPVAQYNDCGPSPVAIFDVNLNATPKPLNRLGTMPEFGDSHDLSPTQFYEKLQARYAANQNGDRPYLNYLFKSMGYSNGFADAQSYMFSDEVLPVGTTGLLGLGEQHHYAYHVLPTNDRDRQAFRIQSANGSVVHFMKTCGNYMYACN